ncbi:viperin family antiviral radical SAM protein [Primorskyibacter sp. 2E233]|uniref:viperin family antiviral radical SAM protein n=1 Tax=Primorskyibacter sp. 2E233 TaxID=3413431 RepID=UPI003BF21C8C
MELQPQLVTNWHVTEACNYRCKFCYAHWSKPKTSELWRDHAACRSLILELGRFLSPENLLWEQRFARRPRLNIAGGEPTLWAGELSHVVDHAVAAGFDVSLITNGSCPETLRNIASRISMLGLSVDSTNCDGNLAIGRVDRKRAQIGSDDLIDLVRELRTTNPTLQIKLNTVVNAVNAEEDFSALISKIAPDRWKILRMLPSYNDELTVDEAAFERFVSRHSAFQRILSVEDNPSMVQSYLMIDPHGRFFQNRLDGKGYFYSERILDIGIEDAFAQIPFSINRFLARYQPLESTS